VLLYLLR